MTFRRAASATGTAAVVGLAAYTLALPAWRLGFVIELAHELRWHVGLAALVVALALVVARAWRRCAVAFVLAAWHLAPGIALHGGGDDVAPTPDDLVVAEVNLWHSNKEAGLARAWLERDAPDVVVAFEVSQFWAPELESWRALYPHQHVVRAFDLDDASRARRGSVPDKVLEREAVFPARWGMAVLSKLPLEDVVVHRPPDAPDPFLEAWVRHAGVRVHVVAVHPERPGRAPRTPRRDALLVHVARAVAWTPTSIAVGDWNATIHAPVYREVLATAGLRDAARGFGRMPTWSPFPSTGWTWLDLDHVAVREGFAVVDARVGPAIGSDHRPLVVRLAHRAP